MKFATEQELFPPQILWAQKRGLLAKMPGSLTPAR